MGLVINPESELGQELAKWNKPYVFQAYPAMLYKAIEINGKWRVGVVGSELPKRFTDPSFNAEAEAETITRQCQLIVRSEAEAARAEAQGWRRSPAEALAYQEGLQQDIATAAAEANAAAVRMTPKAQAERKAREAATDKHVPE